VLIVDDDPAFRRLAGRMLVDAGLTVCAEAGDAREAVAAAHASRPGGILVDVGLPDRDGLDLALELRLLEWRPHVVLTSSDPDFADMVESQRDLELRFVPKEELPSAPLRELLGD
jgi:DNA-binding response OmpR family regulator